MFDDPPTRKSRITAENLKGMKYLQLPECPEASVIVRNPVAMDQ